MFPPRCRPRSFAFAPAVALSLFVVSLVAGRVAAQPRLAAGLPIPRCLLVPPCGGQAGPTEESPLGGLDLDDQKDLLFSTPGIKAALLGSAAPSPPPQVRRRSQRQPMVAQSAVKFK